MSKLAIIPARGGSKRIPRKNIKNFAGKPIIAYSIELALESGLYDEVMVSTDSLEIADIARHYGAKVPFIRSAQNSGDFSTTIDVLKEVESNYSETQGRGFDYICCIYPTAPLIKKEDLFDGLNLLIKDDLDCVFPIVAFSYPIWRGLEVLNSKTKMVWPEYIHARSQDLKRIYHDAGQWYWYKPLKISESLFTENSGSIILDDSRVQDIDTLDDWAIAELKYSRLSAF